MKLMNLDNTKDIKVASIAKVREEENAEDSREEPEEEADGKEIAKEDGENEDN